MVDPKILSSCAACAIMMGGLSVIVPAAWAINQQLVVSSPHDLVLLRHTDYADLNLADDGDIARLNDRVRSAVTNLCKSSWQQKINFVSTNKWRTRCRDHVWDEVRPQMSAVLHSARELGGYYSPGATAAPITISSQ
jgi:UrcA family protein